MASVTLTVFTTFTLRASSYYLQSMGGADGPPYPFDPTDGSAPISEIGPDQYLVENGDFESLTTGGMMTMNSIDPTDPGNVSTNSPSSQSSGTNCPCCSYPTNSAPLIWSYPVNFPAEGSLALSSDGLLIVPVVGAVDPAVAATNTSGDIYDAVVWDGLTPGPFPSPGGVKSVIGLDNTVYSSSWDNYNLNNILIATSVTRTNSTNEWTFTPPESVGQFAIALGADGTIYATDGGFIVALTNAVGITNTYHSTNIWIGYSGLVTNAYSYPLKNVGVKWARSEWDFQLVNTNFSAGYAFTYSSPAVSADGTVYVNTRYGQLVAVNPTNGSIKWVTIVPSGKVGDFTPSPCIGSDGTIYFGFFDTFCAVNSTDGSYRWSFTSGDDSESFSYSSAVIGLDGTIYVQSIAGTNRLFAFTPSTNSPKWIDNLAGDGTSVCRNPRFRRGSIAIAADGEVIECDLGANGIIYSLCPFDGSTNWMYQTMSTLLSAPLIGPDGKIYVESYDCSPTLFAFQGYAPLACSSWPELGKNARQTSAYGYIPQLSSPLFGTNAFQFVVSGVSNQPTCVCASTNLVTWTNIGQINLTGGRTNFIDVASTNYGNRFYMARPQ